MKPNKRSRTSIFNVIFLLCLLAVVLLYLGLVYPKLSEKIFQIDSETDVVQSKIDLLLPFEAKLAELASAAEDKKLEFEANKELHLPVLFSNIIYTAADNANIVVESLGIAENQPVQTESGFEARSFTANVILTMNNGEPSNQFIKAIESNEGCAMYITSMSYTKTDNAEEGQSEEGKTGNAFGTDRVKLTINLLTVEK